MFLQQEVREKKTYKLLFGAEIASTEISYHFESGRKKLSYSGFTNNLIINDPFFTLSQLLLFLAVPLSYLIVKFRASKKSSLEFYNSLTYKLHIAALTTVPDIVEASLLTVLATNFIVAENWNIEQKWDILGFLLLLAVDGTLIFLHYSQNR